jgi:fructuronate reductase
MTTTRHDATAGSPAGSGHPRLRRDTAPPAALVLNGAPPATGIVHLGLGNFHRAHLSVYTARAVAAAGGAWGVLAASAGGRAVPRAMIEQDLLYSVVDIAPNTDAITVPGIHTGVLSRDDDPARVVKEIAAAGTRIVSLTVTEAGYTTSPRTGGLDTDAPGVRADLAGAAAPVTPIGRVARGLLARATTHGAPVTVLSCDNLSDNGHRTGRLVRDFAEHLPRGERNRLLGYLDASVSFPNSMVDRIVPATDDSHRAMALERLGVHDAVPVPAEPFTMWVLEDDFAGGRPAWDQVGATFTADVAPYELMKLRLLNGTHSLLAYLGALDGRATIPEARGQIFVETAARDLIEREYLPTLTLPPDIDADTYVAQLFSRWSNTVLADRTSRVGSDGSVKLPQRITEPVLHHRAAGVVPEHICLTVAAYLACLAPLPGFDPGPEARAMVDPARERLSALAARSTSAANLVSAVLHEGDIFAPSLGEDSAFADRIAHHLQTIVTAGVRAAAAEAHIASR